MDLTQIPYIAEITVAAVTAIATAITLVFKARKSHNAISKQLQKNGGTSLVDKVDNILEKLDSISTQLHRVETWKTAWMELTEEPIFVTQTSGNYIWVNNSYARFVGLPTEDLLGNGWTKVIHPKDKDSVIAEWEACINSMSKFDMVFRAINIVTRRSTEIQCVAKPLKDPQGGLIGYIGIIYAQDEHQSEEAIPQ